MHSIGGKRIFIGDPGFEFFLEIPASATLARAALTSLGQEGPRPPLSKSAPSPATMGPTLNELSPKERKKGRGAGGERNGAVNKIAIWEGKESRGTSSLPSSICEVPIPLSVLTHSSEEALHSG